MINFLPITYRVNTLLLMNFYQKIFFFLMDFFLLEKDIQDHGLAWKFSQDHDNPEIYNTKIQ